MTKEQKMILVLSELKRTNYTQLSDYAGTNQAAWITYRNAVRNMTADPAWPDVPFPPRPDEPPFPTPPD